jgi:hypothetical protein
MEASLRVKRSVECSFQVSFEHDAEQDAPPGCRFIGTSQHGRRMHPFGLRAMPRFHLSDHGDGYPRIHFPTGRRLWFIVAMGDSSIRPGIDFAKQRVRLTDPFRGKV